MAHALWLVLLALAPLLLLGAEPSWQARAYRSEFTLDDLTRADSSYQPLLSLAHVAAGAGASGGNSGATSGAGGGDGSAQHGRRPAPNRLQLLAQAIERNNAKRTGDREAACHPTTPFRCPAADDQLSNSGKCIPIQYLCDGSSDCPPSAGSPVGYDEDPLLCTAYQRSPVEDTANLLGTMLLKQGPSFVAKLFGPKVAAAMETREGVETVAVGLSVSRTLDDFGKALHLTRPEVEHLRQALAAVRGADWAALKELGVSWNDELRDFKVILEKLFATGFFLD